MENLISIKILPTNNTTKITMFSVLCNLFSKLCLLFSGINIVKHKVQILHLFNADLLRDLASLLKCKSKTFDNFSINVANFTYFPLHYSFRITLKLNCPMILKNFPMDYQNCYIKISSCEY